MTFSTCFCHNPLQCMASKKEINCNLTGSSHGRIYDEVPPKNGVKKDDSPYFFPFSCLAILHLGNSGEMSRTFEYRNC